MQEEEMCPRISSLVAKANKLEIKEKEVAELKSKVESLTRNFEEVEGLRKQLEVLSKEVQKYKQMAEQAEEEEEEEQEFQSVDGQESENSGDMSVSTINSEQSENAESTMISSNADDEDPLSTSLGDEESDIESQKRPRSSPGQQSQAKQRNLQPEIGKFYKFSTKEGLLKEGKVKSISGKQVTILVGGKTEKFSIKKYNDYRIIEES